MGCVPPATFRGLPGSSEGVACLNTVSIISSASRRAGGLFESVRRLDQSLVGHSQAGNGITVQVLTLDDELTRRDLNAWQPLSVHPSRSYGPSAFGYAPSLYRNLLALKPDLAHVHGLWQFGSLATLVWHRKTHRPYLVSPHGMLDPWALRNSRWKKKLAWAAFEGAHLRSAACIRALCQAEAHAIRALGLTNPVCVIPNGVDLPNGSGKKPENGKPLRASRVEAFFPGAERTITACEPSLVNRKVLLYLGRIHPKKGLSNLLRGWAQAHARGDWVLVIAGWDQGGHETDLKRLASELRIAWADAQGCPTAASSLIFAGPQFGHAKADWLARCDGFILPSLSEGLPMAILEAWAYTRAVILTPQCNLPEGVAAGAALSAIPEPEALAAVLRELFDCNDAARERLGLRGRALVANRFAWPRIAAEFQEVYCWMIGAGPKPNCLLQG